MCESVMKVCLRCASEHVLDVAFMLDVLPEFLDVTKQSNGNDKDEDRQCNNPKASKAGQNQQC
jgi:hypothetical protein